MANQNSCAWIEQNRDRMIAFVEAWANINSGTFHHAGVRRFAELLIPEFSRFATLPRLIDVPAVKLVDARGQFRTHHLGPALSLRCRPQAARRVLLCIHLDTVYDQDSEFQVCQKDGVNLYGPGVADAKGGIAVMLLALEALELYVENSRNSELGWEVLLTPDEEIGSPGSTALLQAAAERNHLGLLFEPSLPDGSLAAERKGSANFHIVCRGKSAHAGRHFHEGLNAIAAAAEIAMRLHHLNGQWGETTFNVAKIDGGGPLNIVPDVAVIRLNIRYSHRDDEGPLARQIDEILTSVSETTGIEIIRHGEFTTPPKEFAGETGKIFEQIREYGHALGLNVNQRGTGGVCDGNRLAGWGLPNIDTLGVRGGDIHSHNEYLILDSLTERAALTAGLLIGWASGSIPWPVDISPRSEMEK